LIKIDSKVESEFNYEGRIADRQVESEYTTENLMQVTLSTLFAIDNTTINFEFSTTKSLQTGFTFTSQEDRGATDVYRGIERTMEPRYQMGARVEEVVMSISELVNG